TSSALSNQLNDAQIAVAKAGEEITNLDQQVASLTEQNKELDQHVDDLTNQLSQLDNKITATELELSKSQTNNAFLESELKKQVAERAALEQKFNNLSAMRQQVTKLRDDALMATRLRWIKEGTDPSRQVKGAQLLIQNPAMRNNAATATSPNNGNLNVEVESGGAIRIINSPATNSLPQ